MIAMTVLVVGAVTFAVVAAVVAEHRSSSLTDDTGATLVVYAGSHQAVAPPVDLRRLGSAGRFTLTALGHRPLVVNFFASWCTACQSELRAVAEVANAESSRVPFFGIDTNETSDSQAIRLLARAGAHYPVGIGSTAQANEFYVSGLPTTLFVDARGRVVATVYGAVTRSQLAQWVDELAAGRALRPPS